MNVEQIAMSLLSRLGWTSLQAVVLIGLLVLLVRLLPRLSAAMRCSLWWLVGAQLLVGLVWHAPLQLPLLSPPAVERLAEQPAAPPMAAHAFITAAPATAADHLLSMPQTAAATPHRITHWPLALGLLWLAGLLAQLPAIVRHARQARQLLRESVPLPDAGLQAQCAARARALGLRRTPSLRTSAAIASPQVIGWRRPTILLPAGQALTRGESSLALVHELAHVRRGDLWLGWIPALAQRLFFFHPLVGLAMREYALAREAACDAQVLAQPDIEPQRYGQLLLRLGVAHPLRAGLAGASPSFGNLKRRLIMLQSNQMLPRQRAQGWLLVALIALAGVLPYRVTAAAAEQPATAAHAASSASAASTAGWMVAPTPPVPPVPPTPPVSAPPPPPPPPPPPVDLMGSHVMVTTHHDTGYAFALLDGDTTTINGTEADLATVRHLRQRGEPMLWLRRGDKSWTIRDPATIARAKAIYAPVSALAEEQGKLGERQGALGEQQGRLGEQQGRLGAEQGRYAGQQAELAGRLAELAARRAALASGSNSGESAAAVEAQARKLDAERAALDRQQPDFSKQQAALGDKQAALGRQQEALGKQQEALGQRQQEASAKAEKQMAQLLDEAVAKGLAKPTGRG